jgi:iron(III) transport system permease protein
VLTTKIYLQIRGGLIPKYGEASAYSIILIVMVALGLMPYYRITSKTYKYTTISGKAYRPHRVELGRWRWLGGALMLVLPLLQIFPIAAITWSSLSCLSPKRRRGKLCPWSVSTITAPPSPTAASSARS